MAAQRVTHRPTAQSLPVGTFGGYFDAEIIDQVRSPRPRSSESPLFYADIRPLLDAASVSPIDFTKMDQYEILGVNRFVEVEPALALEAAEQGRHLHSRRV